MAALAHLVGDADLAEGGLLQGEFQDKRLDLGCGAVLQQRLAAGQVLERDLATLLVEVSEAI